MTLLNVRSVRKTLTSQLVIMEKITIIATITMEKEMTMKFTLAVSPRPPGPSAATRPLVPNITFYSDYDDEFDEVYPDYEDYDTPSNGIQVHITRRVPRTPDT